MPDPVIELMKSAIVAREQPGAPLKVRTRSLDNPGNLLALLPSGDAVSWVRNGEGMVGWGVAASLEISGPERFSRAQRWWAKLCAQASVDDTVAMPGTGPVAFASFAFDPEPGISVITVPRVLIGRRNGQSWITVIGSEGDPRNELRAVSVPNAPKNVQWTDGSQTAASWEAAVQEAITRINHNELDKVVLARDIFGKVDGELDSRSVLSSLAQAYPTCWTFSVGGLVGATPELLVRRTGDLVTSRVLAGTVRSQGNDSADADMAQVLLNSEKDLAEHAYAVRSVALALAAHCTDLDVPAQPHVLPLANVQHLATDVTGRLADDVPVLALAALLHPTAAVCGTPTERARATIRELEGMDRGRYAGPVGWLDAHGDGEFGIALRCAEIDQEAGTIRAFAGCGIVAGSNSEQELAESNAKLVPIRDALANR